MLQKSLLKDTCCRTTSAKKILIILFLLLQSRIVRGISGVAANSAVNTRKLRTGKPISVESVVTRNSPEPTEKG